MEKSVWFAVVVARLRLARGHCATGDNSAQKLMSMDSTDMLRFSTAVILVGASPVAIKPALTSLPDGLPLIAADGGASALLALGRVPDVVIGDMDSLFSRDVLPSSVEIIHLTGQDDTDFEKCLARIDAPLIIGLGFLEARFDHSLAAIHALMGLRHDQPVLLAGDTDVLLRVTGDIEIIMPIGSRISIWPLGRQSFEASVGLRWPLAGLEMAPGKMIGTSNEVNATPVKIAASKDGDGYAVIAPVEAMAALMAAVTDDGPA